VNDAKELALAAGLFASARALEEMTAVIVRSKRYSARAGVQVTGLH
jgi:hypothetical protein